MKHIILAAASLVLFSNSGQAQSFFSGEVPEVIDFQIKEDVVFGSGKVVENGVIIDKYLLMDVYYPLEDAVEPRPAVILVYGGSFHRGHPRVPYIGLGAQTTTMSDYAKMLASEGYVAFTITYRIAPDIPVAGPYEGFTEDDLEIDSMTSPAAVTQLNIIRGQMGLEELNPKESETLMKASVISAAEALRTAIRHVKNASADYIVDPKRIGLLGFSAGAITIINVAYGMKEDVAAVVLNSGYPAVFNMDRLLTSESKVPPALFHLAQNDYPVVEAGLVPFLGKLKEIGAEYRLSWVPSHGHFYPSGASTLSSRGERRSVEQGILEHFKEHLAD